MCATIDNHLGVSRQIAQRLRDSIQHGRWSVGERLPSLRALAKTYEVNIETVRGSLRELEGQRLIECRPRRGAFVTGSAMTPSRAGEAQRGTQIGVIRLIGPAGPQLLHENLPGGGVEQTYVQQIVHGLEHAVCEAGYSLTLITERRTEPDVVERVMRKIDQIGQGLVGVVVLLGESAYLMRDAIASHGIPSINLVSESAQLTHNAVAAANRRAGERVGRCFARLGYQRLVFLGTDLSWPNSRLDKLNGMMRGYSMLGLDPPTVMYLPCPDGDGPWGYQIMRRYLAAYPPPQGVFTTGDILAFGAARACRERSLSIPDDVGLVGSTGLKSAAWSDPPLTTVAQPTRQIAVEAARGLLRLVREGDTNVPLCLVPTQLIVRDSLSITGAVREELEADDRPEERCPVVWESPAPPGISTDGEMDGPWRDNGAASPVGDSVVLESMA